MAGVPDGSYALEADVLDAGVALGTATLPVELLAGLDRRLTALQRLLMAAPLGYRVDGFYGSGLMGGGDAASRRRSEYSEKDVLEVLKRACQSGRHSRALTRPVPSAARA